jgi:hypothetical protein
VLVRPAVWLGRGDRLLALGRASCSLDGCRAFTRFGLLGGPWRDFAPFSRSLYILFVLVPSKDGL